MRKSVSHFLEDDFGFEISDIFLFTHVIIFDYVYVICEENDGISIGFDLIFDQTAVKKTWWGNPRHVI